MIQEKFIRNVGIQKGLVRLLVPKAVNLFYKKYSEFTLVLNFSICEIGLIPKVFGIKTRNSDKL